MAIEKMTLLSITGPEEDLDRLIAKNLLNTNIQIEDSKKIYNKTWKFEYYENDYRIQESMKKCENLIQTLNIRYQEEYSNLFIESSITQIGAKMEQIQRKIDEIKQKTNDCQKDKEKILSKIISTEKLINFDIEIDKLYDLKYLKFRYGNISIRDFEKIQEKLSDIHAIVFEIEKQEDVIWIVYLTTEEFVQNVDVFFNMQNFERVWLDENLSGKPKQSIDSLYRELENKNSEIANLQKNFENLKDSCKHILLSSYRQLQTYEKINKIKKYIMHDSKKEFYLVTWVPNIELQKLIDKLNTYSKIDYKVEEKPPIKSPTKLKNNRLVRPFETIVKMYGVPNHNEIDPSIFVAITAFIMFGFMFGDVGHGLVFLIGGLFFRRKNRDYGDILITGGISSVLFGFLYGSFFGKEDILQAILIRPMENINTMLIYGIIVGSVFILIAMILNMVNGLKNKDLKRILLDENGLAGFMLYVFVLVLVGWYFLKHEMLISKNIIISIVCVFVILILFNDKLMRLILRKKEEIEIQFVEKIFEVLEMILSFASNTISFLRLAAFAINHVGLCMAIYLLANMVNGTGNVAISVIGNVIVIVLEGLIVGIQILRLEYYELFSRFYEGKGIEYQSIKVQTSK